VKFAAVLVWQLLHWIPATGTCGGVVIPVAVAPLWQLEQLESVAAWVNVPPSHVVVLLWQVSQGSVVGTWFAGLPIAEVPLWQLAHAATNPAWFMTVAPPKLTVL
jgi:hypothetical protein